MSHYKPYPAYKDSGVAWLGDVPAHWQVKRLKFIASIQTGIAKGKDNADKKTIQVPYLRVANVQDGYLDLEDVATIDIPGEDLPRYLLQPGDVLMNEGGDFDKLGRGHVWNGEIAPCIHQNHVFAVRPSKVLSDWLNTYTGSNVAQFHFMGRSKQSTNLASISSTNVMELPVPVPVEAEQRAILKILLPKTAHIDDLIIKKTRFIDLLREKRQALITHAVTKGLDPDVKMKDSGVEWLGEVPAHWEVTSIKYFSTHIGSGKTPSGGAEVYQDFGVLFLRSQNIHNHGLRLNDVAYISVEVDIEMKNSRVQQNDVLLNITGASIGRTCIAPEGIAAANVNQHVCIIRTYEAELAQWISICLVSDVIQAQIDFTQNGAGREGLNFEQIGNMIVALPPTSERETIKMRIDNSTARIDMLTSKTERSIELLKERRSALITAAVTGQIDLREAA